MKDNSISYIIVVTVFLSIAGYNVWFGSIYQQDATRKFYEQTDPDRYEFYPNQLVSPTNK